tara:strand:- start:13322 stop:14008 length:687 start_codon:yes stop_codon:yes gene_type:complete
MKTLIVIPARNGSKGLPNKNKKKLLGKSLIEYSIEFALKIVNTNDVICVTTNDNEIINLSKTYKSIIFLRRSQLLSDDKASMEDVLIDVINRINKNFDFITLLQPTSPIRDINDYYKMTNLFSNEIDLVVSVKESKANPYFTLFEENDDGFLIKSKEGNYTRRQDCPKTFCYNGSIYLIKIESLVKYGLHGIKKIKKFLMPLERSIDIDSIYDWKMAELIINNSFENS